MSMLLSCRASVAFFTDVFMREQRILSCLSEAERALVQEIVMYAVGQTDMAVSSCCSSAYRHNASLAGRLAALWHEHT
jgi:hypothetical protein